MLKFWESMDYEKVKEEILNLNLIVMETLQKHNMSISMANPAILTSFDFTAIDEMDPSL